MASGLPANTQERLPKILLIEDNETFREAISERLKSLGFKVRSFASHQQIIKEGTGQYSLIISDAETDNAATFNSDGANYLRNHREEFGRKTIAISSSKQANEEMLSASKERRRNARCAVLKPEFSSNENAIADFLDTLSDTVQAVMKERGLAMPTPLVEAQSMELEQTKTLSALVIEDNFDYSQPLQLYLKAKGINATVFPSHKAAAAWMQQGNIPDVIFCDACTDRKAGGKHSDGVRFLSGNVARRADGIKIPVVTMSDNDNYNKAMVKTLMLTPRLQHSKASLFDLGSPEDDWMGLGDAAVKGVSEAQMKNVLDWLADLHKAHSEETQPAL